MSSSNNSNNRSSNIISITLIRTMKAMPILSRRLLLALLARCTGPLQDLPPPTLHGVNHLLPDFRLHRSMDSFRSRSSLASPFISRKLPSSCSTLIPVFSQPLPSPSGKRCCRTSPKGSSPSAMTSSFLVPSQARRRWYVFRRIKYESSLHGTLVDLFTFLLTIWTNTGSMFFCIIFCRM